MCEIVHASNIFAILINCNPLYEPGFYIEILVRKGFV